MSGNSANTSGTRAFFRALADYRKLALAALTGGTLPLALALLNVAPPWPEGVVALTSAVEVVAVIVGFHLLSRVSRAALSRWAVGLALAFLLTLLSYLAALSLLTYETPFPNQQGKTTMQVIGLRCNAPIEALFPNECPILRREQIKQFEYDSQYIWTPSSMTASRLLLISLWFLAFFNFAFLFSGFLSYQGRR